MAKEKKEQVHWGKLKDDFQKENLVELRKDLEDMKKFLAAQKEHMEKLVGKLQSHGEKINGDS